MPTTRTIIADGFAPEARALRAVFDDRFAEPRSTRRDRFVWDYWHIPGQYTALRTPAFEYFPKDLYEAFHTRLVLWGREHLGCHDVSPPWLSLYVDGCGQDLHGDLPHGPFAFVFSLTDWSRRRFSGGETLIAKDATLDYWEDFRSTRSVERKDLLQSVPHRFNRLTVFDGRLPHGVRDVSGTRDPREGRLVINGWFVQPRPFIEGPVPTSAVSNAVERLDARIATITSAYAPLAGLLSLRLMIASSGMVESVRVLVDTLRAPAAYARTKRRFTAEILRTAGELWFPRAKNSSRLTLPLVFVRESETTERPKPASRLRN